MRNILRNSILGVALAAGLLGAGAATANAAGLQYGPQFQEEYIPQCPGDGYVWVAGYYNDGYWVPGAWVFRGHRNRFGVGYYAGYYGGYDRGYAYRRNFHDDHRREGNFDRDRRFEQQRHGDFNRGPERGGERGGNRDFHGRR